MNIKIHSRNMSDPTLSDIDIKNKIAWVRTTLNPKPHPFFVFFESEFGLGENSRNIIFKSYQRKIVKNHETNQKL